MCTEFIPKWRPKTKIAVFILFFYKKSTQMPPITLLWNLFLMQISWQLSVASEKNDLRFLDLTKWLQNPKWRPKSIFSYFCSQSYILYPISKIFFAFKASVHYLTFMEETFFQKSKMAEFFKMASFLRKNRLFVGRVFPTLNLTFFKNLKRHSVVQRPKIYQKNLPRKILQNGGNIQDGVCVFFSY